ncbi:hypothetical protein Leryth_012894 [Lithospermum erythrorhizon]|nr:hypothetical protein Leryth_012894 [Lithospermum erythrorhizon]
MCEKDSCYRKKEIYSMAIFSKQLIIPKILLLLLVIGYILCGEFLEYVDEMKKKSSSLGKSYGVVKQREFDYFKLALQWPATRCRNVRKCSSNASCRGSNSPTHFTIHGLWPDYNDGTWPACCSGPEFNVKEVSTLADVLNKNWPSLSCSKVSTCHRKKGLFWAHEWGNHRHLNRLFRIICHSFAEKHGTCSSPVVRDEYDYFIKTINLYFKYNVTEILTEAGYVASNSEKYPLGGIISAIQNAFHANPEIECKGGAVEELRLCFFKDFKPRDCNIGSNIQDAIASKSSCPKYVSLPAFTSTGLLNFFRLLYYA